MGASGLPPRLDGGLDGFRLEKAIYEMGYELNARPDWLPIPLRGILELVDPGEG